MKRIPALLFLLLVIANGSAIAADAIGYVYARREGPSELVYRLDGKSLNEAELGPYLRNSRDRWSTGSLELRLVFDGDVPLAWFFHARRTFTFLGFGKIRCFSGSVGSERAVEIEEVGAPIVLPEQRW